MWRPPGTVPYLVRQQALAPLDTPFLSSLLASTDQLLRAALQQLPPAKPDCKPRTPTRQIFAGRAVEPVGQRAIRDGRAFEDDQPPR